MTREPGNRPFAKKSLGQNFLANKEVVKKIVRAADVREGDRVLEIGPGRGALTEGLVEAGAAVTAIEFDRDLVPLLKERFGEKVELIEADALKFSFAGLARDRGFRFKLVANLPYYISGPLLARLLDEREAFSIMVLMFQKEVARRIAAPPGTREYGSLSVLSRLYADVRIAFNVSRGSFLPVPKVDSSVIVLSVLPSPRVEVKDEAFFKTVVRAAFGQRRKTLLNALKALDIEKDGLRAALEASGIDPARRGETLSLDEFWRLSEELLKYEKNTS